MKHNVEVISPAVAAEYLKLNLENQRPINLSLVGYYARMMKNGQWQLNGDSIRFSDKGSLIDGQHRLRACIEAGVPFETCVIRDLSEDCFKTIDSGQKRSAAHVFKTEGIENYTRISTGINSYLKLTKLYNPTSIESIKRANNDVGNLKMGEKRMSVQELLDEYYQRPLWWQSLICAIERMQKRYALITPSDVCAIIAFLVLNKGYEYDFVINFFEQLFFDECTKFEVIRILRTKLINDKISLRKMTPQYKTQLMVKAWNLYRRGKDAKKLKWASDEPLSFFE